MRLRTGPDEAAVIEAYRAIDRGAAVHARVRAATCPFDGVMRAVPRQGAVLDLGCGHGLLSLLLAMETAERAVTGVDLDEPKLEIARSTASRLEVNVRFLSSEAAVFAADSWDAIVVVDVLYLLGRTDALALLGAAASALRPGGSLIVKEISTRPRWKYLLAVAQERLATGPLRITQGAGVAFLDPNEIESAMLQAGLAVERTALDKWYPHPHQLFTGRSPGGCA